MDFNKLFEMGAELIRNNDDEATTGLDIGDIAGALGDLFGGEDGGADLSGIVSRLSEGGLGEVVSSWIGNGENLPIDADTITDLLGSEKISEFASRLGIGEESAGRALADALPNIVDQATNADEGLLGNLLESVGGVDGAMDMMKKFFG